MKIVLFGAAKPEACHQIESILHTLPQVSVVDASRLGGDVAAALEDADMAVSVGGDGTFLRTAAIVGERGVPILGVNAGRLGFLADISLAEAEEVLPAIVGRRAFLVEARTLLRLDVPGCTQPYVPYALNEVAVLKHDQSSMVSVSVLVDGTPLSTYDADGVIVATPTGSTAYAMSAGGPILEPLAPCFEILPIAPHSLTSRPLVIRDTALLELRVEARNGHYLVAVDGRTLHLTTDLSLRLSRADHSIRVVRRPDRTFFDTLRQKLMWGADVRN